MNEKYYSETEAVFNLRENNSGDKIENRRRYYTLDEIDSNFSLLSSFLNFFLCFFEYSAFYFFSIIFSINAFHLFPYINDIFILSLFLNFFLYILGLDLYAYTRFIVLFYPIIFNFIIPIGFNFDLYLLSLFSTFISYHFFLSFKNRMLEFYRSRSNLLVKTFKMLFTALLYTFFVLSLLLYVEENFILKVFNVNIYECKDLLKEYYIHGNNLFYSFLENIGEIPFLEN